jgi:hypothetical protein
MLSDTRLTFYDEFSVFFAPFPPHFCLILHLLDPDPMRIRIRIRNTGAESKTDTAFPLFFFTVKWQNVLIDLYRSGTRSLSLSVLTDPVHFDWIRIRPLKKNGSGSRIRIRPKGIKSP